MSACHINILVHNRIRLLLFCKVKICTFGNFSPGREIFDQKEDGTKVSQIFKIVPDLNQFWIADFSAWEHNCQKGKLEKINGLCIGAC